MPGKIVLVLLLSLINALFANIQAQGFTLYAVSEQCANPEEKELYELISELRRINGLTPVSFSKSLSYVARIHAMDLSFNRPDFGGCNPHSWSTKGIWKSCCYSRDDNRLICMNEKPKELTTYKAKAWEIVYDGGEPARAADAFELWKNISITRDYMLNSGKWAKPWKAIGIGFYGDYGTVWFGEGDDPLTEYYTCGSDSIRLNQKPAESQAILQTGQAVQTTYHIITGSLNTIEKANQEVARMRSHGYKNARIIPSGNNFRISVSDYVSEAEAQKALEKIKTEFPDAWILKPL
ncbi:MAG: SPOR domain-containing protein [Lentimicrobium sp.]|nr:SPOR domain-containing protein [Lentimicrobium sp.]